MPSPTPGTIPALPSYQPAALPITGTELVEIASSANATSAISASMKITDIVGKVPSVLPGANPTNADIIAFFQAATGLPRSSTVQTFLAGLSISTKPVQRSITGAGNLPVTNSDDVLNVNAVSDLSIAVPLAAPRLGTPLTFKNLVGSHAQTLVRSGSDTFDGQTSYPLTTGASVTFLPYNDGVNSGYAVV